MISFIIPAYNEEASIDGCLDAIRHAMAVIPEPHETIVVDDASTDQTADRARARGARVIHVSHRHISATRNSGAHHASGRVLFFVDADTQVSSDVIQEALAALDGGAVGGGCIPRFEGHFPWWLKPIQKFVEWGMRWRRLTGGACQFCTTVAYDKIGGFSEAHFAAEDLVFAKALKREGRFVVPRTPVITSARHVELCTSGKGLRLLARLIIRGPDAFQSRQGLDIWYSPRRSAKSPK